MTGTAVIGDRPNWHQWAMGIAEAVAARTDCTRDRVGAVILDTDHRVIATGYPGVAAGSRGCLEGACPRGRLTPEELPHGAPYDEGPGLCISTHAEINAMLQAGPSKLVKGSTIYVTRQPCSGCEKIITNSGIGAIAYRNPDNGKIRVRFV
jgi:dCMP deaminase